MKTPYRDLHRDERELVMENAQQQSDCCMSLEDWEAREKDRTQGINAEPNEGFRDGLASSRRMNPDHYIPNRRSK